MGKKIQLVRAFKEAKERILELVAEDKLHPQMEEKIAQINASGNYGTLIDSVITTLEFNEKPTSLMKHRFEEAIKKEPDKCSIERIYYDRFVKEIKPLLNKTTFSKEPGL